MRFTRHRAVTSTVALLAAFLGGLLGSAPAQAAIPERPAHVAANDVQPPAKVTGIWECVADFTGAVPMCWTPGTDNVGVAAYDIYMQQGSVFNRIGTVTVPTVDPRRPYFAATGLVPNQFYTFYIVARDLAGNVGPRSDLYTARAQQGLPAPTPTRTPTGDPVPPTPTPTPTASPTPTGDPVPYPCEVTHSDAEWGTGFSTTLRIKNITTNRSFGPWQLRFHFPGNQRITQIWNTTMTQSGQWVTVNGPSWSVIGPGQTFQLGFNGSYSGVNNPPTDFTLNGAPCRAIYL
ncbi:cellulose binding domain-containing protein [Sphaerisporangium aureirubrum]|uniref:Cellulose binding domain-containing protein n=1 Tax=Sphaerisporangium aureirubrum TaxID=1544736 RepID=A0ABW1NMU1_9ACTN